LIEIGSKTAEKNSAQTNRQTNKQTDTTYKNNGHFAVNQEFLFHQPVPLLTIHIKSNKLQLCIKET